MSTVVIQGACHCGAVQWRFKGEPDSATACNCTTCRRYGALWAYGFEDERVDVTGPTQTYTRGMWVVFHFCATCGCVAYWRGLHKDKGRVPMGVNVRMTELENVARIPIRHHAGLEGPKDLPSDGRCVADYWF